jgi:hypothetical protein
VNAETAANLGRTTQAKVLWQNLYTASPADRAIKAIVNFFHSIDAEFYNIAGQKVLTKRNTSMADISNLSKGICQVRVNKGSSYKLVVE